MTEIVVISKADLESLFRKVLSETTSANNNLPMSGTESERLNQKQAAEYIGITESTIIRWKKKGVIPYEQMTGSRKVFFYKSQIKAVIQQNPKLLQAPRN